MTDKKDAVGAAVPPPPLSASIGAKASLDRLVGIAVVGDAESVSDGDSVGV
jgi:hypothetical protein